MILNFLEVLRDEFPDKFENFTVHEIARLNQALQAGYARGFRDAKQGEQTEVVK